MGLCSSCAARLVSPHPRLYRRIDSGQVTPGAMVLCAACEHRTALECGNPGLKRNGGPGLAISTPRVLGVACGDGGCQPIYYGIPSHCAGRVVAGQSAPDLYGPSVPAGPT